MATILTDEIINYILNLNDNNYLKELMPIIKINYPNNPVNITSLIQILDKQYDDNINHIMINCPGGLSDAEKIILATTLKSFFEE